MISKISAVSRLYRLASKQFSSVAGGNLYTWGLWASGTGFDTASLLPRKVEEFQNNVSKVSMGPTHTAVITTDGALYTFGIGNYGALGTGNLEFGLTPTRVSFFEEQKLKVKDVVAGQSYTVAITENGQVFSWGYGGQPSSKVNIDFLRNILLPERCGGLGSGNNLNRTTPQLVENLSAQGYKQLSGGDNFVNLINSNGEVVNWGAGFQGSLGNGSDYPLFSPEVNQFFKGLKEKENLSVVKVKSAAHFSVALLSNGQLYSYGVNTQGQLGIRENLGHNTDSVARLPTPVNNKTYLGQKVVKFTVGENSLVFLTDKNEVYFSGLELAYMPIRWEIPTTSKIVHLVASLDSFAAVAESGKIYQFNQFVGASTTEVGSDYNVVDPSVLSGKVVALGGKYGTRYAITN